MIQRSTEETEEISKGKLRKALAEYGKYGKMADPQEKVNEINALYDSDPEKYRYGKEVLYKLEEIIMTELELSERANLSEFSEHIKIKEIEQLKI